MSSQSTRRAHPWPALRSCPAWADRPDFWTSPRIHQTPECPAKRGSRPQDARESEPEIRGDKRKHENLGAYTGSGEAPATAASLVREVMPSFGKIRYRWLRTVRCAARPPGRRRRRRQTVPARRRWPASAPPRPGWRAARANRSRPPGGRARPSGRGRLAGSRRDWRLRAAASISSIAANTLARCSACRSSTVVAPHPPATRARLGPRRRAVLRPGASW
jgi:hypothetical protein